MQLAISAKQISKVYRNKSLQSSPVTVFLDFNIQIENGSFTVLYGPNGCGKSTLIYILAGIIDSNSGTISVFDGNPNDANIGIVFQNYSSSLFPWLTVFDNICFGVRNKPNAKNEKRNEVEVFLNTIGLSELLPLLDSYPYMLSGGQQQMLAIARALFPAPPLLFLDEPFTSLSKKNRDFIITNIQDYCKKRDITCVFAVHDLDDAILLADDLIILQSDPMRIKGVTNVDLARPRKPHICKNRKFADIRKIVFELIYGKD